MTYFNIADLLEIKEAYRNIITKQQKETKMKEAPMKEAIPHLKLRRQWLDDIEKDPNCVWMVKSKSMGVWAELTAGTQPWWSEDCDYQKKPNTKTFYMVMVKHKGVGKIPFAISFSSTKDIQPYLDSFSLDQVGDVVSREVEQ